MALASGQQSRILYVKNMNYNTQGADLYELFGRYGAIRQIRIGTTQATRGSAYIVYEEMGDAKNALSNLNGFHLQERYIVVLYHVPSRLSGKGTISQREEELMRVKSQYGIHDE
ncbi:hypothetical protein MVES1_001384 [Malassezia vespertilionis]|uniref:RRM domain-containing protein n=1 Tax=Malassezia vespertilionis TaxID=2020962 RepID=A0A2N1JFG8_9BASI|nr:uncharacterized protein MVES1_001384 [Malassezia vespertilionis]PKI85276.1 hypothetical protein MVES_001304 [Malassezia vespertilionis]WFD06046.1 hypothetical protein MVES1_001384 [Malassezia vespertilionis]